MTAPSDLSKRKFGRLTAIAATYERRRREWRCRCTRGRETLVPAGRLVFGGAKSCGHCIRRGRPFSSAVMCRAAKAAQELEDGDELWYSLARMAKYLDVSPAIVQRWAKKGCNWLGGAKLRTRKLRGLARRLCTYYSKAGGDEISSVRAARLAVPDLPDRVHVGKAAEECGVAVTTIRRTFRAEKKAAKRDVRATAADGKATNRLYLPRDWVERYKASRSAPAPGKLSIREVAKLLGRSVNAVRMLIRAGKLKAHDGTVMAPRGAWDSGPHPHPGKLIARHDVEALLHHQVPTTTSTPSAAAVRASDAPKLTQSEWCILDFLFDQKVIGRHRSMTAAEIAVRLNVNFHNTQKRLRKLADLKLVERIKGNDGGWWLSDRGEAFVAQVRNK
jgi:hypothetical protein